MKWGRRRMRWGCQVIDVVVSRNLGGRVCVLVMSRCERIAMACIYTCATFSTVNAGMYCGLPPGFKTQLGKYTRLGQYTRLGKSTRLRKYIYACPSGAVFHIIDVHLYCEMRKLVTLRYLVSHKFRVKPLASGLARDGASSQ